MIKQQKFSRSKFLPGSVANQKRITKIQHSVYANLQDAISKDDIIFPKYGFHPNRWNECASGIHFFMTFDEAANYEYK